MDWWSSGLNAGCPVVGQTGAGSNGQYGSLGLDSSSQQLDMGQQHQLAQQQQQQQQQHQPQHQCQQPSDFDHWLACDDLELGAIIQQVSSGAISSPGSDASAGHMQTPLVGGSGGGGGGLITEDPKCAFNSVSNGPSSPTSTTSASLQAAPLTSDNKRHIMSIINNTLPPSYNSDAAEPNQQQVIVSASSSSTAASPLSSSLGSSPLNSLSSHYSVQSPNSPANNNSNYHSSLIGDSLKTAPLSNQRRPQHEQQQLFLPHASQSYRRHQDECFGSLDYRARLQQQQSQQQQSQQSQQQEQQSFGEQQLDRIIISTGPAPASRVSSTQASTRTQVGGRLHGQASKASQSPQEPTTTTTIITTTSTSSSSSSSTGAGCSLLTSDCARPTQAKGPAKQTRKTATTATRGASATSTSGQGLGQKLRRCRTITDYVLAEEEKRLLIKEGHTEFPMICESRPLTKIEERILRKIRRKIRNKKSAQCSRQRKKEYVEELERKYAVILRENGELKQMLARVQQQQQPASHQNREQAGGDHLQPYGDTCNETQTSCSADAPDLIWKDLFQPQSVSARLAAAAAQQQQYHEPAGGATYN